MAEEEDDGCQPCLYLKLQAPAVDLACAVTRLPKVPRLRRDAFTQGPCCCRRGG